MGNASGKSAPRSRNARKTVHWKAAGKPSPPGRPELVSDSFHLDPDVVTLKWTRPVRDGGSPIIGYMVEHKRTGSPHWVRAIPGLVGKPELSISGLEPGWRYQFRVIAHNIDESSEPSELSEPLTVTLQRNIITAPRFVKELQDTVALENEKVEFFVEMTGIPPPTVCWYKDGFEIFSSRRTRILTENGQSVLVIHQTALVDEGEIKCTATNKAGYTTCKANLEIEAPPRIRLPRQYEDGLLFELDEAMRLKVTIAGKPVPDVFWSHNGESIANDPRYEISTVDRMSTLKVSQAKRIDRGEYQIRAVNKLGEHTASFLVTVTDRPTPPTKLEVKLTGKSVVLSWHLPEDDGGCKIGNYIVEYYRVGWNVWLKAGTSRKLYITLGELIEGSEYRFRLKAENPYGISEPSAESETIFIPDPRRGIFQPPLRSKSQSKDILDNVDNIKGPVIQNMSIASSKSSLSSRPTSPGITEPIRPMRGQKIKTPSITPDPSPITRRRDAQNIIANNIFDRSSVVRELTYGSPTTLPRARTVSQSREPDRELSMERRTPEKVLETKIYPPVFKEQSPKPNDNLAIRNDDILHGSSEFMLVLLPDRDTSTKNRKGGSTSNINFELEDAVAPPMSLSAPELGFEPPFLGSLRYAVSSSELLHERAMMRFYEATQNEQAEKIKNAVRYLAIGSEFDTESNASRRCSFEMSNTPEIPGLPTIRIDTEEAELLERRHSLRRRLSGSGISQQMLWQRRLSWNAQQKASASVEGSQEHVEKKIIEEEENVSPVPPPVNNRLKPGMIRQRSESEEKEEQVFEQVRAKMAKQNSQEEKKTIDVASEEKWEEEVVQNAEADEEVEDEELDEDVEEEEEEEELSEDDRPWLEEEIIPERVNIVEEEVYHPKIMIPRQEANKADVPFEILTKPSPLPDPNFIPKPILKKKDTENEQNQPTKPVSPTPEKPQRKIIPIKPTSGKFLKNITGSLSQLRNKKSNKMEESGWSEQVQVSQAEVKSQPIIIISAAEAARKKRLESRQNSLEETKVVIDHYTDIVREYGQTKKATVPLYLNTESLKKAAESQVESTDSNQSSKQEEDKQIDKTNVLNGKSFVPNNQPAVISRKSPNLFVKNYIDQSSDESINTKLKKSLRKIESSDESLNSKVSSRKFDSSEESIASSLRSRKTNRKTESSDESLNLRSQKRPLKLVESRKAPLPKHVPNNKPTESRDISSVSSSKSNMSVDEKLAEAEIKVRTTVDYLTDVAMLLVACWLYLFHDAIFAIPILILMIYRQLSDEISKYWPSWLKKSKKE